MAVVPDRSSVSAGSTLALRFTASAYAEGFNPGIYGDNQPRGLRVGSDANNAIEFYSAANAIVGMRVRNGGVGSDQTHAITPGVASMHLYEISVTSTSAVFRAYGARPLAPSPPIFPPAHSTFTWIPLTATRGTRR